MSKKRVADNYITDQNWDRDDEKESDKPEPFKAASEEVLKKRTFKKAARRVNPADKEKVNNPFTAFGGFGGFGAKAPSFGAKAPAFPPVNPTSEVKPTGFNLSFSNSKATDVTPLPESVAIPQLSAAPFTFTPISEEEKTEEKPTETADVPIVAKEPENVVDNDNNATTNGDDGDTNNATTNGDVDDTKPDTEDDTYVTKLASLNKCLLKWVEKHMEDNDCIDLTPVFSDYEKHLKEISV